jgi:HxlR-like helix-turn-helix
LGSGNLSVTDEENLMPEPTPAINPSAAPSLSRQVLDRIADRWTILVFLALVDGPQRFSELARRIDRVRPSCSPRPCAGWNATAWCPAPFTLPCRHGSTTSSRSWDALDGPIAGPIAPCSNGRWTTWPGSLLPGRPTTPAREAGRRDGRPPQLSQIAIVDDAGQEQRNPQRPQRPDRAGRHGWGWLAELLEELELAPHLVHPSRCKAIAAARLKNDKVDARTLAQLLLAELELCRPSQAIGSARPSSRARLSSTTARLEHQIATCQARPTGPGADGPTWHRPADRHDPGR